MSDPTAETAEERLARALKAWMESKHLGVTDLYKRSGVSRATLHEVLAARRLPSVENLYRIAEELGVTPGQLLDGVMPPTKPTPNARENALAVMREAFEKPSPLPAGMLEAFQDMQDRVSALERKIEEQKTKP